MSHSTSVKEVAEDYNTKWTSIVISEDKGRAYLMVIWNHMRPENFINIVVPV